MYRLRYLILFFLLVETSVYASTGEVYGYGSRSSAMGNTVMGSSDSGFTTFYNPALTSWNEGLHLSVGFSYAKPTFKGIDNVTVANSATSAQTNVVAGSIDTSNYLTHFGQALGASYNLGEEWKYIAVGFTGFLPIERLAYIDTGEPFKPEYFSYRARTQRPQIYAAMSARPFSFLGLGAGVAFSTNLAANADLAMSSADGSVSYSRFSTSIKPGVSPYAGLFFDFSPFKTSITARMANKYEMTLDTKGVARVFGPANSVDLVFSSASSIFYDPLEFDFAMSYKFKERTLLTLEVDWYNYKKFESPSLSVKDKASTAALKSSIPNLPTMRDIFVPKMGFEREFNKFSARIGYYWRPSPVQDNSGSGNLVDPEKHVITIGAGLDLQKINITKKAISLDVHGQYHWLVEKHITKTPGNEAGNLSQSKIGSPGYDIGGKILAAGLSVTAKF